MSCLPRRPAREQQPRRSLRLLRPVAGGMRRGDRGGTVAVDMIALARARKFDEILERLTLLDSGIPSSNGSSSRNSNGNGNGSHSNKTRLGSMYVTNPEDAAFPLHAILKHRPPVKVVNALIKKLQQDVSSLAPGVLVPEEMREKTLQQTPLHVAVSSFCSLAVIERLLEGESLVLPAMTKDGLHRFPLHWACALPHSAKPWSWQRGVEVDYRWDLIHYLLEQYPVACVIPDAYDQTPLDYARHNKLHVSIVELLEYATAEYAHYAPNNLREKQKQQLRAASPMKEKTEVTSIVSFESDGGIPAELRSLTIQPGKSNQSITRSWWGNDEVSSLGGDYSISFTQDDLSSPTSVMKNPIAHVTSLFSSALMFGNAPPDVSETSVSFDPIEIKEENLVCAPAVVVPVPPSPPPHTAKFPPPAPVVHLQQPIVSPYRKEQSHESLLGGGENSESEPEGDHSSHLFDIAEQSSESSGLLLDLSEGTAIMDGSEDDITSRTTVGHCSRAVTLLRGNLLVVSPRRSSSKTKMEETNGPGVCATASTVSVTVTVEDASPQIIEPS